MIRLYLFAEGQTEQTFASSVLMPHLARHGVMMHNPVLIAHGRKRGRPRRGGGWNYEPMRDDIVRFLKQEKAAEVCFTTMVDLYALHRGFPGLAEAEKLRHLPYERVALLESAWAEDINDPRFVPFLQLHEFEAILFTRPETLAAEYTNADVRIARLRATAEEHASPELIDDGADTAPSKRIIAEFPDYAATKRVVGPQPAELIGLDTIRSACPHFHDWPTKLESLDRAG